MKVKFFYKLAKNGELWAPDCDIIDDEKYDVNYSRWEINVELNSKKIFII